jgi:hypothetical protein
VSPAEFQLMLGNLLYKTVMALPWVATVFGGIALLSWGPLGKSMRRLSRARDEELAVLRSIAESAKRTETSLENLAERQDYLERTLSQRVVQAPPRAQPVRDVTPH